MKRIIFCISLLCVASALFCQPMPDSLKVKYELAKTGEEKGRILYANLVRPSSVDSLGFSKVINLLSYFKKNKDEDGADYIELYIASTLTFRGDYSTAINMALPILSRFEKRNDQYGIMQADHHIAMAYDGAKDKEKSLAYSKKSIKLAETVDPTGFLSIACNDIGVTYSTYGLPDSGLIYAQRAVNIDTQNKDTLRISTSLSTLGENYMAAGEFDIALPFLRKSFYYMSVIMGEQNGYAVAYGYNDFAQVFLGLKQFDSSIFYAQKAKLLSQSSGYKDQLLRSYEYLNQSFNKKNEKDSLIKYLSLASIAKDSLYSTEKTRNLEAASFREQIRQQEMDVEKVKTEEERKQNIQFALIAFGIISFIVLFLLFTRSIVANERLISFFGVLGLLIVFEFINLLIHPWLAAFTHESPVLMLLALVLIASLLIPMHHRLEHWIKEKMIEKNKAIRLAAAKKTIEELERK